MRILFILIALCLFGCNEAKLQTNTVNTEISLNGNRIICDGHTGIAYISNPTYGVFTEVITPYYDSDRMPMKCEKLKDIYGSNR